MGQQALAFPIPDLRFEAIDRLAHRGLHAPELARRRGEAARDGHSAERAELFDDDTFQHG